MYTLGIPPDSDGFTVDEGNTNVSVTLDGGAPRVRADQLGAVKTVGCQWTVDPANFDYMMAFYRTGTGWGANPFSISLCGIDSSEFTTYTARFVPGSFKPIRSQTGLTYVISAQMWIVPTNDTSGDAAILEANPTWDMETGEMINPMTTEGDIIIGGASGAPTRLAAGSNGQVLTSNGPRALPSYQTPSGGGGTGSSAISILSPFKPTGTLTSQKNEYASLAAGASMNLVDVSGADGYVANLFVALEGSNATEPTISIAYDGEETPTVNAVPIMQFFASIYEFNGSGQAWNSLFMGGNGGSAGVGLRCSLPIPYSNSIVISINNGSGSAMTVFSTASICTGVPNTWSDARKLQVATYYSAAPTAYSLQTLINASGLNPGRLLGVAMLFDDYPGNVTPRQAELEGDVSIYLDGAETANLESSGTEDFFGFGFYGAGIAGTGASNSPTNGNTYWVTGETTGFYRWFYFDPITFTNALEITWPAGDESQKSYTGTTRLWSTVWFYTT